MYQEGEGRANVHGPARRVPAICTWPRRGLDEVRNIGGHLLNLQKIETAHTHASNSADMHSTSAVCTKKNHFRSKDFMHMYCLRGTKHCGGGHMHTNTRSMGGGAWNGAWCA